MKWEHVRHLIGDGTSGEAIAIRDGLGAQVLVVTDQMRAVRQLDLTAANSGRLVVPCATFLFAEKTHRGGLVLAPMTAVAETVRRYVFDSTVGNSGLGVLCEHISRADAGHLDHIGSRSGLKSQAVMDSVVVGIKGNLGKAAKLASKATALAIPIMDPDGVGQTRVRRRKEPFLEAYRWGGNTAMISRESLEVIADRRLVVDRGHQDITDLTAKLRDLAELHAQCSFFDREQGFAAIAQARAGVEGRGFVRAGDDRQELLLQVADVAAGWGRTLIAEKGYLELAKRFRCVLYNGRPLDAELATRIDSEISEHRVLIASFARRG